MILENMSKQMEHEKYIICDLDGTLCNHEHRLHLAWLEKWDEYNGACEYDSAISVTQRLLFELVNNEEFHIIFLTGRSIKFISETIKWINSAGICTFSIIMRENEDYRPAPEFKKAELLEFLEDNEININNILYAIDDDIDCCTMFKQLGIKKVIHFK